jgi:hypothetical protein
MSTQIILKVLALRHRLRQRDRWTHRQLEEHQGRALHHMREYAYARSLFYRRFHKGITDRPLGDLPVLTKQMVMEHFDELITDPTIRLAAVEAHLAALSGGDEFLDGRYRVASTSGSTGRRGLFVWDPGEWATVLAFYNRSFDWAGVKAVSVPSLATMVLLITAAINGEAQQEWNVRVEWISAVGEVAFCAGIASVFFHYHWVGGVAFLISSGLVSYIGWAQLKPYVSWEERPDEKQN